MSTVIPFTPAQGSNRTATIAAAGNAPLAVNRSNKQVRILNIGTGVAHVRFYSSSTTPAPVADANDFPVGPNSSSVLSKAHSHDLVSVFSPGGGTVHVVSGEGF